MEPRSDWAAFSSRGEREEISGARLERPTILKGLEGPWSGGGAFEEGHEWTGKGGGGRRKMRVCERRDGVRTEACRQIETLKRRQLESVTEDRGTKRKKGQICGD